MKAKKSKPLLLGLSFALVATIALTACGTTVGANESKIPTTVKNNDNGKLVSVTTTSTSLSGFKNGDTNSTDVAAVPAGDDVNQPLFWEINEFEDWMEQQHTENQKLADSNDKSFYVKDGNGDYVCREWTQKDVDELYSQSTKQLANMKQGYQYTKSIELSDGSILAGSFDPKTLNGQPASTPGSTIVTLPNGSTVDLGVFDTTEETTKAVKECLDQQVKAGKITQMEADKIYHNGSVEK